MKIGIKLLVGFIVFDLLVAAFLYAVVFAPLPQRSGEVIALTGLESEVRVTYDERGIPAIHAGSELDAYRAVGFVQAQHRLFHMDLNRRLGCGRLAEIFGERALNVDRYFRTLGISHFAKTKAAEPAFQSTDAYRLSMAYVDGINQYIASGGTSLDYWIADIKPEPFTLVDLICVNGNLAHNFAKALTDDFTTSHIWSALGPEYAADLAYTSNPLKTVGQGARGGSLPSELNTSGLHKLAQAVKGFREAFPIGWLQGSNAWVMSAERGKMKSAVMVNDPHIGFGMPSVWFEASLITPDWKKHGFFLSGVPFAVLGHDENVAWGLTMLQNDDMDFFVETCLDEACERYKTPDGESRFEQRIETIQVKDEEPVQLTVKLSRHGPIMNEVLGPMEEQRPIAMRWSFTDPINAGFETFLKLNRAKTLSEFEVAVGTHHSPGLNFAAVDREGNIGIFAGGALVRRPDGVDGHQLQDGASGRGDWLGYRPFAENPRKVNPEEGYAYSANHRWYFEAGEGSEGRGPALQGYFSPDDRWMRIDEKIKEEGRWDLSRHTALQLDVTKPLEMKTLALGLQAPGMRAMLLAQPQGQFIVDTLEAWRGAYEIELVAPTIVETWTRILVRHLFEDELGTEKFELFVDMHAFEDTLRNVLANPQSPWWKRNGELESRDNVLVMTMTKALGNLRDRLGSDPTLWRWGRVHYLEHRHPFGRRSELLDTLFSVGPFEVDGGRETVNNFAMGLLDPSGRVNYGPSTRRVIFVGEEGLASTSNPVGQSLHLFDEHRQDQAERFVDGGAWQVAPLTNDVTNLPLEDVVLLTPTAK